MNHNGGLMSKTETESNYHIKTNCLECMRVHRYVKNYMGNAKKTIGKYFGQRDTFKRYNEILHGSNK